MILGLGIDICPIDKIAQIIKRQNGIFEQTVYTDFELNYSKGSIKNDRLAARFAAKEATIKALGAPAGVELKDIEVQNGPEGNPFIKLHKLAHNKAHQMGVKNILLSLSHAGGQAVAVVILEDGK